MYDVMVDLNMGPDAAVFYEHWAYYYMLIGNFAKGSAVLNYGIHRKAEPLDNLLHFYELFKQAAIVTNIIQNMEEDVM